MPFEGMCQGFVPLHTSLYCSAQHFPPTAPFCSLPSTGTGWVGCRESLLTPQQTHGHTTPCLQNDYETHICWQGPNPSATGSAGSMKAAVRNGSAEMETLDGQSFPPGSSHCKAPEHCQTTCWLLLRLPSPGQSPARPSPAPSRSHKRNTPFPSSPSCPWLP